MAQRVCRAAAVVSGRKMYESTAARSPELAVSIRNHPSRHFAARHQAQISQKSLASSSMIAVSADDTFMVGLLLLLLLLAWV